ncbi:acyltransferase family protein [Ottowia thiooxydans]|uniref:acyltransferase family protein n=1 Tax=Ottowia thiooxydans TaxID=219182 RepID=UPI0003FF60C8|nr:acyltransferase [Ottowia thiooxydans]
MDFLRGIAALAVLVWHYQHFFYPQAGTHLEDRSVQPFYSTLRWLYDYGGHGVQFFWILSGFVFFHAYKGREQLSLRDFAVNRFSRLYPLHLATLLLVAVLQFVSAKLLGYFQIYPINDLYHFVLNLFMVSHWGLQKGWAFNAPIWSVSVEIVIYGLFFVYMKSLGIHLRSAVAWFVFTWVVVQGVSPANVFSQCALLFILGGVVHELHASLSRRLSTWWCAVLSLAVCVFAGYGLYLSGTWSERWVYFGLFPGLIWLCTSLECLGISAGRAGRAVGNLSYASYLLHVPIQIAAMTAMDAAHLDRLAIVRTPSFLAAFLVTVCLCSYWVFRYVELPLKEVIRQRLWLRPDSRAHVGT